MAKLQQRTWFECTAAAAPCRSGIRGQWGMDSRPMTKSAFRCRSKPNHRTRSPIGRAAQRGSPPAGRRAP